MRIAFALCVVAAVCALGVAVASADPSHTAELREGRAVTEPKLETK